MFASQHGLGYLLMNGIGLHNVDLIMAVTLVIIDFAVAVSSLLLYVDHRVHPGGWHAMGLDGCLRRPYWQAKKPLVRIGSPTA